MTTISRLTLEVDDLATAETFYAAFGVGDRLTLTSCDAPNSGFRGCTISLVVARPNIVDAFLDAALAAGARSVKPVKKSFWGYGGVVEAPDGTLWKVATSGKKNDGPRDRVIDDLVLLLGVEDVKATKEFYAGRGLVVGKSFGNKYVDFEAPSSAVKLALYGRRAAAKDAGVPPEGSGSHRIVVHSDAGTFTDPDGFIWTE
ncbi:MAG TPA: glyoxalase [Marmoricola sp.]|jgi:predicted lactoylglutathione lyase|nr:glyoxalase [Marmoricola sp.]